MNSRCYIYAIRNSRTRRSYIGSSVTPIRRWSEHVSALNNTRHHNGHLQEAWDASNITDWEFQILEVTDTKSRYEREAFWIGELPDAACIGYNISKVRKLVERDTIIARLQQGMTYREISAETGSSLGRISYIKQAMDGRV